MSGYIKYLRLFVVRAALRMRGAEAGAGPTGPPPTASLGVLTVIHIEE